MSSVVHAVTFEAAQAAVTKLPLPMPASNRILCNSGPATGVATAAAHDPRKDAAGFLAGFLRTCLLLPIREDLAL